MIWIKSQSNSLMKLNNFFSGIKFLSQTRVHKIPYLPNLHLQSNFVCLINICFYRKRTEFCAYLTNSKYSIYQKI